MTDPMPGPTPRSSDTPRTVAGKPLRNKILGSIPEHEFEKLWPFLEPIAVRQRQVLHEAGGGIDICYFLNSSVASLVIVTSDGRTAEVGMVGREGVLGSAVFAGCGSLPYRAMMQAPGDAWRMPSAALISELPLLPVLARRILRASAFQALQIAQMAACNRLHEVDARLARWLLMAHDRTEAELLTVTHDVLAQMLGTGRPSISLSIGMLERSGTVENLRGRIRVLDRPQLEQAACECYSILQGFSDTFEPL